MSPLDATKDAEGIADMCARAGLPITDDQRTMIAGFLAMRYAVDTEKAPALALNEHQVSILLEFLGGDLSPISIGYFPKTECPITGDPSPAGLYVWCSEYPEEGRVHLPEADPDFREVEIKGLSA